MENLPVDQAALEARLREQTKAKLGAPGGDKIKLLKSKKFKLPTGVESAGPLKGVIIDFVPFNAYFDRIYSEKDRTPPACFALAAVKPHMLTPSDASPVKQSETCKVCKHNKYGTKGAGKACGNHYLLGFVACEDDEDSPLYLIQCAPKTTKHWETYANGVDLQESLPPIGVETEIYFDPNEDQQVLRFHKVGKNPRLAMHMARQPAVLRRLLTEPDVSGYVPLKAA